MYYSDKIVFEYLERDYPGSENELECWRHNQDLDLLRHVFDKCDVPYGFWKWFDSEGNEHRGFTVVDFDETKFESAFEAADKYELLGLLENTLSLADVEDMIRERSYRFTEGEHSGFHRVIRIVNKTKGTCVNDILAALCAEEEGFIRLKKYGPLNWHNSQVFCEIDHAMNYIWGRYDGYEQRTPIKEAREVIVRELKKLHQTPGYGW
jgi:hypothetical protein